jgi:trehalose 6-phosphate phosphatase
VGRPIGGVAVEAVAGAAAAAPDPVLVAVDVDGTLSPLVPRADQATLLPGAAEALADLASHGVAVAVVSGRGLADLRNQFSWPSEIRLVGSHGLEDAAQPDVVPTAEERQRMQAVRSLAEKAARSVPGTWIEDKVTGLAFHYREAVSASKGSLAAQRLGELLERMDGVWVHRGHLVVEASVRPASKAVAIARLADEVGAGSVTYVGDDETDEEVFRALASPNVTVRVGPGETAAQHRLADPAEVVDLLHRLASDLPSS